MIIRKVERDDIDSFVNVYEKSYEDLKEYAYRKRREIKNYFKWLYSRDKDGFLLVEDQEPIAFVACDANWYSFFERRKVGEVHELFVLPEYRNKGIGTKLLLVALDYAKNRGRRKAELWVGERNYRARRFYKKLGFEETGSWGKWIRMVRNL